MSQHPLYPKVPDSPSPYDPYRMSSYQAAEPAKPGSITVLAVLAIVFGALGSLCMTFGAIVSLLQLAGVKVLSGPAASIATTSALKAYGAFAAVVELGLYLTLLAIGIGALSLKRWSWRTATAWWPLAMISWAVIRLIAQLFWINPASLAAVKQIQQATPNLTAPQTQDFVNASMLGGSIFIFLIQLLLPVLFLSLWRSTGVTTAFAARAKP